jgi:TolB-like protein
VLLFTNIGGDPSNQALCDGLFEVVSNALTGLEQFHGELLVVPANDVRKEGVVSTRDAGRKLGANLAVTGSVQRTGGNGVQVMISLSDTRTVTQLRTETIRAQLPDLAMQDQVVQKVARMLELALLPQAVQSMKAGNTTVAAAYPSYVEGLGYLRRYDRPENIGKAIASFG